MDVEVALDQHRLLTAADRPLPCRAPIRAEYHDPFLAARLDVVEHAAVVVAVRVRGR